MTDVETFEDISFYKYSYQKYLESLFTNGAILLNARNPEKKNQGPIAICNRALPAKATLSVL